MQGAGLEGLILRGTSDSLRSGQGSCMYCSLRDGHKGPPSQQLPRNARPIQSIKNICMLRSKTQWVFREEAAVQRQEDIEWAERQRGGDDCWVAADVPLQARAQKALICAALSTRGWLPESCNVST